MEVPSYLFVLVLICGAQVVSIAGHSWLNVPVPRDYQGNNGNSASTTDPCGNAGTYTTNTYNFGATVSAQWTRGGGHNEGDPSNICRFALVPVADGDTTDTNFNANVIMDNINCEDSGSHTASLPLGNRALGTYILQFKWTAGDGSLWYNCAQLTIQSPGAVNCTNKVKGPGETDVDCGALCPPCGIGKICSTNADCTSTICIDQICQAPPQALDDGTIALSTISTDVVNYYTIVLTSDEFVMLNSSAPSVSSKSTQIYASLKDGSAPTAESWDYSSNRTVGSGLFSICALESEAQAYIGVTFSAGAQGSYQFGGKPYKSLLAYQAKIEDSLPAAGSKYYHTPVYSTDGSPKIVVVNRTSGTGELYLDYHRDTCGEDYQQPPSSKMFKSVVCVTLDQFSTDGDTFLHLSSNGAVGYEMRQEVMNNCDAYASASTLQVGVVLAILALIVNLLY